MRITDRYRAEHAVFVQQLGVLTTMLRGGASLYEVIAGVRTLAAPLRTHAENEEHALFPALGPDADAPVQILTQEHSQIERWIGQMTAPGSRVEVATIFASFDRLLRGHIVREDEVLFPMAERALDESDLVALDLDAAGARA